MALIFPKYPDGLLVKRKDYEAFILEASTKGYLWADGKKLTTKRFIEINSDHIGVFDRQQDKRVTFYDTPQAISHRLVLYTSPVHYVEELYNSFYS